MKRQLEKWGLTEDDAKKLMWEEVTINEKGLPKARAIKIPYFEPTDTTRQVVAVNGDPYVRYRILPHELSAPGTPQEMRYCQPRGTGVEAYYPPIMQWEYIDADITIPIIITEGEAKAARACKEGFATIGLGGVNSFRSNKRGIPLCNTLRTFNWRGRVVYIAFDSDIVANENIVSSLNELAETLIDYYAIPYCVFIPAIESDKIGIDDYINKNGADEFDKLLDSAVPVGAISSLIELNRKYYVIRDTASIYSVESEKLISRNNFVSVVESTKKSMKFEVTTGGKVRAKQVSAAEDWLKWPMRSELRKVIYEPGKPKVLDSCLNIWKGWGCSPKKGDASWFTQLVDYLFSGAPEKDKKWFLQWLSYPLQYPGTKLFTAAVLYSQAHGTGKSFLGQIVGRIYGSNFAEISPNDLGKSFNEWAENKQFILGDEITSNDKRKDNDSLKKLITQGEMRINKKYMEEFVVRDCVNYLFTTNHPDAFFLEDKDRRFFIHEIDKEPLDSMFYEGLHKWIWQDNGAEYVFDYLLNIDCSDFNPRSRAPDTIGKALMFESGLGDVASWIRSVLRNPDSMLSKNGMSSNKDIFTAKELLNIYDPMLKTKVTSNGMTRELARAGCRALLRGDRVTTSTGYDRVYAVRNVSMWENAGHKEVQENVGIPIAGLQKF